MAKAKNHYHYECPRCGSFLGTNQVPLEGPPWCQNFTEHHSQKSYLMVFDKSRSTKDEPNPYPKSKKKVIYT